MAQGHALLVGLKSVDPVLHGGWDGKNGCWGCELDVDNLGRILSPLGFRVGALKTADATRDRILGALRGAAATMRRDDLFVFYFSGHGGQQLDTSGDEPDGQDETLVAYDFDVVDDDLAEIWKSFRKGVRIVMLSDSCNSGTNYRMMRTVQTPTPIKLDLGKGRGKKGIDAQLIHFGGCRDGLTSAGYNGGGAFTMALCKAWDNGDFQGSYRDLHQQIVELTKRERQQPQYNEYGGVTSAFHNQRPFTIGPAQPDDTQTHADVATRVQQALAELTDRIAELEQKFDFAAESERARA